MNLPNGVAANDLRTLATDLRNRLSNDDAIVVLASENDGKLPFIAAATKSAVARGVKSGDVVNLLGGYVDGRGGGKPDMAQGAGSNAGGIEQGFAAVRDFAETL